MSALEAVFNPVVKLTQRDGDSIKQINIPVSSIYRYRSLLSQSDLETARNSNKNCTKILTTSSEDSDVIETAADVYDAITEAEDLAIARLSQYCRNIQPALSSFIALQERSDKLTRDWHINAEYITRYIAKYDAEVMADKREDNMNCTVLHYNPLGSNSEYCHSVIQTPDEIEQATEEAILKNLKRLRKIAMVIH